MERRVFLNILSVLVLLFFSCSSPEVTYKNFECQTSKDCKPSQTCQNGKCVKVDNDKDGWAKDKDCDDSNPKAYPGAPEICDNNIDDNCNSITDEKPCICEDGKERECGTDKGLCRTGKQICQNGEWSKCEGAVMPEKEVCDGQDNDCDGSIDENLANCCQPGETKKCGSDVGECKSGIQKCDAGKWTACEGDVGPKEEVCDGKDNDCDGQIDNIKKTNKPLQRKCYTGPKNTRNKGACKDGVQFCNSGKWGPCQNEVLPEKELCNGKDDDCDGQIDNIAGTNNPLKRNCYSGPSGTENKGPCRSGVQTCIGGQWGLCQGQVLPTKEICNNQDDDCDGMVDNQPSSNKPLTKSCYTGPKGTENRGICKEGIQECIGGQWKKCKDEVLPRKELCNGKDDDCDGYIDNGVQGKPEVMKEKCYTGPKGTENKGICKSGLKYCRNGKWSSCENQVLPRKEVCNGKDDDCDGQVDEGNPGGGAFCNTGKQGLCSIGVLTCKGGKIVCSDKNSAQKELCNKKDDDCDGKIDNTPGKDTPLTKKCYTGPSGTVNKGICKEGVQTCINGKWTSCKNQVLPVAEVCDAKDNDCDGLIDESLSRPCGTDVGECRKGKQFCMVGVWGACSGGRNPYPEVCDGKDNDCDGRVDEGNPGGGAACLVAGKLGVCRNGRLNCVGGRLQCVQVVLPSREVCDAKDNDCDGQINEGATCPRGQECSANKCQTCTQPSDTKCKTFLGICISNAPCPPCRCGLTCYCKEKSIAGYCARASCK